MPKLTYVKSCDCDAIYVDNQLCAFDRHLKAIDALEIAIEKKMDALEIKECDDDWFDNEAMGEWPDFLSEIRFLT